MKPPELLEEAGAESSALHGRAVFVLATPGSGAELLLRALDLLPRVATVPVPTHLFTQGLGRILDHWVHDDHKQGLWKLGTAQDVLLATRLLGDTALDAVRVANGADVVVEYSPEHATAVDDIIALYPDAHLLHLVRDGRQVAAHLTTSAWKLGAREAARRWVDDQRAVLELGDRPNLHILRFEDLVAAPAIVFGELSDRFGLEADPAAIAAAASVLGDGERRVPASRGTRAGTIVEIVGPDLLLHYGYDATAADSSLRVAAWGDLLAAGAAGVGKRLAAAAGSELARRTRLARQRIEERKQR
ncbi:MAG: sulfotransferase [Acidimicrobiia bacterium]|nr:sulfotransferase [Acidimicrobiia bacterium]